MLILDRCRYFLEILPKRNSRVEHQMRGRGYQLKQRLNISDSAMSKIVQIPKRTLDRRREKGRLKTDESERVLRLAQVYDMAFEVFGSQKKVESWLKNPARGLGGKIPLQYADTDLGAHEVINLLGRIDHGVFPG